MRVLTVLFVHSDLQSGFCDYCSNIHTYLRQSFPRIEIHDLADLSLLDRYPSTPDIILLRTGPTTTLSQTVASLRRQWPQTSIIGLTCGDHRELLQQHQLLHCIDDFVFCPFHEADLTLRLHRALILKESTRPCDAFDGTFRVASLIGESPLFRQTIAKIPLLAQCDATVLILGETGTGKELFARAVHYHSHRRGKPFIPINCGALPDHLFENELFGHSKGAFTDASTEQKGLLTEADGGTLFLDEVDSLSHPAQIKLLRVLQDREYRPLGSAKTLKADVRILAASNASLQRKVEDQTFREDLYYRLNVLSLALPPLRDRVEDIPVLAQHFLARYNKQLSKNACLTSQALHKLLVHSWPGNVRELEAVLQRAVTLATSSALDAEDLQLEHSPVASSAPSLRHAKSQAIAHFERAYLVSLLIAHKGNISRAAQAAGKERRTFQRLVRKYGLDRTIFSGTTNPGIVETSRP